MISDEEVQACIACDWNDSITEIAKELLAYREAERKSDMLTDSAWIAGAKFGWNCGVVGDNNALQASIESRIRERAEDKKERPK